MKINILLFFAIAIFAIFVGALVSYPGNKFIYIIFTMVFNGLLLKGFYRNKFYFESFFASLLWLGFWLKFSVRTLIQDYSFKEATGQFDFTPQAFDRALEVSSIGGASILLGFLIVHYLFKKNNFLHLMEDNLERSDRFLRDRKYIYPILFLVILVMAVLNLHFGIYQRGSVPHYNPPALLRGALVWLLLTGFAATTSTLIFWEIKTQKNPTVAIVLSLVESLLTSLSMFSRGFIINTVPQLWSTLKQNSERHLVSYKRKIIIFGCFFVLFVSSVISVNIIRSYYFAPPNKVYSAKQITVGTYISTVSLFIDRWVGIEGVMSVSSYPNLSWDLLKKIINEKAESAGTSFYDTEIGRSVYSKSDLTKQHHITLPGIVAFLFYPGSYMFLILGLIIISILCALSEALVKTITFNPVLSALFAHSVAYRLIHFGYLPKQSYMYFAAFAAHIVLVVIIQKYYLRQRLKT